ncbi:hypothetical protein [Undibacterium sp.]|uniref:hypothetical protein n=1 Tax=Undibacterium sp. TaxID=1914977 RepID=UPI003753C82E
MGVEARLGRVDPAELSERIDQALNASGKSRDYSERTYSPTVDEIARLWGDLILRSSSPDGLWAKFFDWSDGLKTPLSFPSLVALSRRVSLTPGQQNVAMRLAECALKRIAVERESAESKAESYVSLARAMLLTSNDEARQYFEDAIVVSSKIGEENLNRWDALLYLADASVSESTDEPELAYRLSRAAELTYAYVVRDKHFNWSHTIEALAKLSCSSSLTILSRWIDRRFGYEYRLLPRLVEGLALRNVLDRRDLMPLIAFQGGWDYSTFLEAACEFVDSAAERQKVVGILMRYLKFSALSSDEWRRLKSLFARWHVDVEEIEEMVERAERKEEKHNDSGANREIRLLKKEGIDWDMVFSGAELTDPDDIKLSIDRFKAVDQYCRHSEFLFQATMRITPGREQAFIEAYDVTKMPDLHDLADLLAAIPGKWLSRVSVRPALARLVKSVCRRCAGSLSVDRDYQPLPADLVSRTAGLNQADMIAEALESFASATLPVGSRGLFRLVGLLSKVMDQGDALKALRYGLDLLEPVLEPDEGDGEWRAALEPPKVSHDALAGYLWAALGSPTVGRRWQAAHAVRLAAKLERTTVLDALVRFAMEGGDEPFWDHRLRPYRMHALQWLMIAFDRSSRENGLTIARYASFLHKYARGENRHVLLRGLSARALVSLASQGVIQLSSEEIERLVRINASQIPHVETKSYARAVDAPSQLDSPKRRFLVDYDFGESEVSQLARAFSIHKNAIEQQIENVIWNDWGLEDNGHWNSDARSTLGFFRENGRRDSGESDRQDNLSFYLSYHALMETAGKLLETVALHEDPDDDWSSFRRWLSRRDLTRSDGTWLSDLRDLTPMDCLELPVEDERSWPDSMTSETAASVVHPTSDAVVVAGRWTQYSARRMQTIGIRTALVCSERSASLARAMTSVQIPWACGLPNFDNDDEIHHDGYALDGWIREIQSGDDDGVGDPWAAGLDSSMFEVASPLASSLSLTAASTGRAWMDATGNLVLWNESWSDGEDREDSRAGSGKRLVVKRSFLDNLVVAVSKTLIFEVIAKREIVYRHYETDRGKSSGPEIKAVIRLSEKIGLEFTRSIDGARPKTSRPTKAR